MPVHSTKSVLGQVQVTITWTFMFKAFMFNVSNSRTCQHSPIRSKAKGSPHCLFIILIFIIYIIFLNTIVATLFYSSSSSYVSSSFMELHIFTYQWICTQFVVVHVDLKNGSKMKGRFFFLPPSFPFGIIPSPRIDYLFSWALVGSCHGDPLFQLVDT